MNHHTQPIGIAVAGCGYWGINYVRLFQELPGASLIGVFDIRPERVDLVRQRFPTTATFPSMEALLADPRVEAVAICTEAMSHYATAGDA
jgi:predicted dehydrogenase